MPKLTFGSVAEQEAIQVLAHAANVTPERRSQLSVLLDYLKAAGLIAEENGNYRIARSAANGNGNGHVSVAQGPPRPVTEASDPAPATRPGATVATAFTAPTEGVVQFHVSVRVDMREFASWQGDRISAFFNGIAEVLNAKAGIENSAKTGS